MLTKRAVGVKRGDLFERNRLNLGALPLAAESQIAFAAEVFSSLAGGFEVSTRIKARGILNEITTDGSSHGETDIRVDVDFAYAVFDRFLNFLDRKSVV